MSRKPTSQAYWNTVLKREGLGTIKGRQVFRRPTNRVQGRAWRANVTPQAERRKKTA